MGCLLGEKMENKTKQTLGKIAKELIPVAFGAGLAGIVKAADLPEGVLVLPPLLQLTQRFSPYYIKELKPTLTRDVWNTTKYIIGIALPYVPEIYQSLKELI